MTSKLKKKEIDHREKADPSRMTVLDPDLDQDQDQEVVQPRDVEDGALVPGEEVDADQEVLRLEADVDLEVAPLEEGVEQEVHHQNVVNGHQLPNRLKLI